MPLSDSEPTIDVLGIGNALVDVIAAASPQLVESLGLVAGSMNLIEHERRVEIYEQMGPGHETSGGSAANTMAALASFGATGHYFGRVRDDQLGEVFAHDIRKIGVGFTNPAASEGPATGCCLVLVTPDAERTMNTFLGAAALFGVSDVDPDVVRESRFLYMEGYLFDRDEAKEAYTFAASTARQAGRKVALSLSDSFCVDRHRDAFIDLCESAVDVVFANESELLALTGESNIDAGLRAIGGLCEHAVVTRGEHGATTMLRGQRIDTPAVPVAQLVDTTGAGDMFAAGYLFGLTRSADVATCSGWGAAAASEVISHYGPRPEISLSALV